MSENSNINFKLRLSSFISGSFSDNSPFSPTLMSPSAEKEIFSTTSFSQMRSSLGQSLGSPGQVDSPFSSAQGVDIMKASIECQQVAIVSLRANWLGPMKAALDVTGRLADVARCHRLSRILEVNVETVSVEEELRNYLASVANQKLTANHKLSMDAILKESRILQEESEGRAEDGLQLDRKTIELKIYYCHESLERILRSLWSIVTTLSSSSGFDDSAFQFDRFRTTLLSQTAVETLIMALPQKYNLEVINIQ